MDFNKLRDLLEERNVTQIELSNLTGISKTAINGWIKGRTATIDSDNLVKVSRVLGVTPGYFFNEMKDEHVTYNPKIKPGDNTVTILLHQNSQLIQQVNDLIKIQMMNAEAINKFANELNK